MPTEPAIPPTTEKSLRVGYVSGDLCAHPVGLFFKDVLAAHDPARVLPFAYSNGAPDDEVTRDIQATLARFHSPATGWREVRALDDAALAAQIRADRIDILVDLSGHTGKTRLPMFAWRPAPVQVSWLGYFATTGLPVMDAVILDPWHAPPGTEAQFTEALVRLPHNRFCYSPVSFAPAVSPAPTFRNGHVTFGSFNNTAKLNETVLATWAQILCAVPDSRLILKWRTFADGPYSAQIRAIFGKHGIASERIELRPASAHRRLLEEYADIDIALDPFPFSGGHTSCEALWMGVPVITWPQKRVVSRQTWSFLANIGLTELAAESREEYVAKAVVLAQNKERLLELRQTIRQCMAASPLCDVTGFTRNLEKAYRDLGEKFSNQEQITSGDSVTKNELSALYTSGQYVKLEVTARQLLEKYPSDGQLHKALALALAQQGKDALASLERAAALLPDDPDVANDLGTALKQNGRINEAQICYGQALALRPDFAEAHYNLGNLLRDQGNNEDAIDRYRRAIKLKPHFAVIHNNLGNALKDLGRYEEAVSCFSQALILQPDYAPAHNNLGSAFRGLKRNAEAVASFRQALTLEPNFAAAQRNLALTLHTLKDYPAAIDAYLRALELEPQDAELHYFLGTAQLLKHDLHAALSSFRLAVALNPEAREAHNDLGNVLKKLGRLDDALSSLQQAQALNPDSAEILTNLGMVCKELHRHHEAVAHYQHAIGLKPDLAEAHNNLALCWHEMGRLNEAEQAFRQALVLKPDFAIAHANFGSLLKDLGRYDAAIGCFERALLLDPEYAEARDNLLFVHNLQDTDPQVALAAAHDYGVWASARIATSFGGRHPPPATARSLTIGWVSGDLCIHPVGYFLDSILTTLVREHPELSHIAYANHCKQDELSARLKSCCRTWHPVMGWCDAQLAAQIHADGIDILIDLAGHTAHNRLPVFVWKPAPVQVTWLGYFATTGVREIDYLIADPWTLPPEEDAHFTEQIWRLPETRLCFTPPTEAIPVGPLPALSNGYLTFGCFNNLAKMNDAVVALWSQILAAIPDSRLLLKTKQLADASVREHTFSRFAAHGIHAARITLEGPTPRADYLAAYQRIDIALDPFPYPGGTTTVEALWMGVPVLTLAGERFLARQGVGLLMNAGLSEWVASDTADYCARAIAHAWDLPRLAALRNQLRPQLIASPLCDASRFADHFASALRGMWREWCNRTATS